FPFGTSLAFNAYWIDTIAGGNLGNYQFQTPPPIAPGFLQQKTITKKEGITELAIAGATNLKNKLMFGATLAMPLLNYKRDATFIEADATTKTANKVDFASFRENLTTEGVGFNLKMGLIYKPTEYWRLGFAIHTPSFYFLTDKYTASVTANTESYQGMLTQSSTLFTG